MKAMNAVVGYLPDVVAKGFSSKSGSKESLEVKLEQDTDVYVRIMSKDVAGVLLGASKNGETSVQVFLNENATVETFTRGRIRDFLKPIKDFSLIRFRPPVNMIFVDPQFTDKLVEFNRRTIK